MRNLFKEAQKMAKHSWQNWKVKDDPKKKEERMFSGYLREGKEKRIISKLGKQKNVYTIREC